MERMRKSHQRGFTLVIGLVMLLLLTMIVTTAFVSSGSSLQLTGNMQARQQALAAANSAIDKVISNDFSASPGAEVVPVDINLDDVVDYTVNIATPECVAATVADAAPPSSVSLPVLAASTWNTVWDLRATVTDQVTGTELVVRSGIRVLLENADKEKVCP